ncbi:MAG: FKBP-type peptidyl-prolyl cis-trans isomerase [Ferruginibacter sp.]|nr:FKBP-type peptidyl-prolyl cis-trans isomerase [Cytophagales bacterium]
MKKLFSLLLLTWLAGPAFAQTDPVAAVNGPKDTVTTMTGLKYLRLRPGNGLRPKSGDRVSVLYTGRLPNGRVFDSSSGQVTFRFRVGRGEVIPGWDEGFLLMSEGEKAVLIVPPHLAYGEEGSGYLKKEDTYVVPPNSTLVFELELLKVR